MSHVVNHFFAPTTPFQRRGRAVPSRSAKVVFHNEPAVPARIGEAVQAGLFVATALLPVAAAYLSITGL